MAVMTLEILIGGGAESVVFAGFAGSLSEKAESGSVFLPSSALSTEGTSSHYPAPLVPDGPLRSRLAQALGGAVNPASGAIWSTDAPLRETPALCEAFRERGALAVDMVTSALFAAAGFRGQALAAALLISDEFRDGGWRECFGDPGFKHGLKALSDAAWKAFV
jgi:uridine phosphorylase